MLDFLRDRKKAKLHKQWIEKSGLSPDDVPPELQRSQDKPTESDSIFENEADQVGYQRKQIQRDDTFFLGLRTKYIYIMGFVIAILLITVSVISTILVMQVC
ncbi:hypothetical protein ACFLTZ_03970 [Chloroflexota bacterium]